MVETEDGPHFVKLRGAAQGTAALVAEVVVAGIADLLNLPVPPRRVIHFGADLPSDDQNDELADLLGASAGDNLGFRYLPTARPLAPGDLERITPDFASQVRWLDWLVLNPDRSPANPNILVEGPRFWLIDHGAALPFQHDWPIVTESTPHRAELVLPHLLEERATRVREWDPLLSALVTRSALADALAEVPASFLQPLIAPGGSSDVLRRRRAAYEAFLWKRLQGPRPWLDERQ